MLAGAHQIVESSYQTSTAFDACSSTLDSVSCEVNHDIWSLGPSETMLLGGHAAQRTCEAAIVSLGPLGGQSRRLQSCRAACCEFA